MFVTTLWNPITTIGLLVMFTRPRKNLMLRCLRRSVPSDFIIIYVCVLHTRCPPHIAAEGLTDSRGPKCKAIQIHPGSPTWNKFDKINCFFCNCSVVGTFFCFLICHTLNPNSLNKCRKTLTKVGCIMLSCSIRLLHDQTVAGDHRVGTFYGTCTQYSNGIVRRSSGCTIGSDISQLIISLMKSNSCMSGCCQKTMAASREDFCVTKWTFKQFLSRGEFRMVGQRSLPSSDATKTEHNLIVISQGLDRLHSVSFRSSCAICPLKKNIFSAECNHQYCSRPENGWTKISSSPSLEKLNFSGRWAWKRLFQ